MQNKSSNVSNASFEVKSSDREPIAGNPHDGFCGGGATRKSGSLLTSGQRICVEARLVLVEHP